MKSKKKIIIFCLAALLLLSVSFTIAYLQLRSGLNNQFTVATVEPEIVETFNDGQVKSNVKVKNNGNVPVYVRCKVVVYFETKAGNISATVPKPNTDYSIKWGDNFNTDWFQVGDIYYYNKPLNPNDSSSELINRCTTSSNKKLVVDISAQSIQADPSSAVADAWKDVSVTDGNLTVKEGNVNAQ